MTRRWQGEASTLSSLTVDGKVDNFIFKEKDRRMDWKMSLAQIAGKKDK
jgi:hypothetical protein